MVTKLTAEWYEESYLKGGSKAQRKYPNEELCRFIGRTYGKYNLEAKHLTQVLEVGCGSGGNLSMLCSEGFNVMGLDLSGEALNLCSYMLKRKGLSAELVESDMCNMINKVASKSIDLVIDIFSSNCLDQKDFDLYLAEINRILKPGGKLFIYTPSKKSDAFLNHSPSTLIDNSTLNGICREDSPFYGNVYPFRFEDPEELSSKLNKKKFEITYLETTGRTYNRLSEYFEFIVICAHKSLH